MASTEYYQVVVAYNHLGEYYEDKSPYVPGTDTSWRLSDHRYLLEADDARSDDGVFRWAVRVMHRTGIDPQGKPEGTALGPLSAVRTLIWRVTSGGGGGGTPKPPPP